MKTTNNKLQTTNFSSGGIIVILLPTRITCYEDPRTESFTRPQLLERASSQADPDETGPRRARAASHQQDRRVSRAHRADASLDDRAPLQRRHARWFLSPRGRRHLDGSRG